MDLGLKGKRVVVLAGSAGLGLGVAKVLTEEGCSVAICGRDEAKLAGALETINGLGGEPAWGSAADVSDATSLNSFIDRAVKALGGVDVLVANAGGPPPGRIIDMPDDSFLKAHELSFMSVVRACRAVVPHMIEQRSGRIIALTSTSVKVALESLGLSNIYRSAVAGYIKTLAIETGHMGIRAHTIMTGPFVTDRTTQLGKAACEREGIGMEAWLKRAAEGTLVGRFGDPTEMGALVAFLAGDRSDFMTGTCIAIDGGALRTVS